MTNLDSRIKEDAPKANSISNKWHGNEAVADAVVYTLAPHFLSVESTLVWVEIVPGGGA